MVQIANMASYLNLVRPCGRRIQSAYRGFSRPRPWTSGSKSLALALDSKLLALALEVVLDVGLELSSF